MEGFPFFFCGEISRKAYPEANSDYLEEIVSLCFSRGIFVTAIESRMGHLHIGVTPTSGADTPAYIP